ncbi:MAG: glycoside hydrolase family 25 protein [Chitinophagaceae bacterium]|nr:MAG: glycoside hydrolase family 25 protein [Chitinophagaceae bacterium]
MGKKTGSNRGWKIFTAVILAAIVVMIVFSIREWWLNRKAHFVMYDAFGIDMPVNYAIHGIDVSRYQQVIDWESVRDMEVNNIKIGFGFIKATEGINNRDPRFRQNWRRSKDAGVVRGAYHFFIATKSGKKQAENFISSVELAKGDLPPVLDVEQTYGVPGSKLRERVKEWLTVVENYYGVRPIIYTNVDFYQQHLKDEFDEYPLWVAHYFRKTRPRIHRPWVFWQHSEQGRVNGVFHKVDFNVFNGDSADFRNLLIP